MFPLADQTAGPNGLNFLVDTGGDLKAKIELLNKIKFFYKQCRALKLVIDNFQSCSNTYFQSHLVLFWSELKLLVIVQIRKMGPSFSWEVA